MGGTINGGLIAQFFINGNLNSEVYLHLLQNEIILACATLFSGEGIQNDILLQQDGHIPHYGREVLTYLNHAFPRRWIGRRRKWSP